MQEEADGVRGAIQEDADHAWKQVYPIEEDADAMRRRVGEDADEVSRGEAPIPLTQNALCFLPISTWSRQMSLMIVLKNRVIRHTDSSCFLNNRVQYCKATPWNR
jgi:hypothetical protein